MTSSHDDETIRHDSDTGEDETVVSDRARGESASQGRRIGRYRLLSELGQGGQGTVYLAEDERLRRKVALKVLFGGLVHSTEARLRFEREAEATGRLNHPGIAKIYEMNEADGILFIAMEVVVGESLSDRLKEAVRGSAAGERAKCLFGETAAEDSASSSSAPTGTASRPRSESAARRFEGVARFMEAAARAVHAAHDAGLVHRDIKPANIMVRKDGSPCILDFGLAHDEESGGVTLTGSQDRFGTPAYMAPEQVRGQTREIDCRTDVWALGATLYECCTLKRPFEAPTLDDLYERIKHEEPQSPRILNPTIPKDLDAIILTAIDKDRDRRYATALDLAEDLRRLRSYEPVMARPAGPLLRASRWVQRNAILSAAALVVFLALVAVSGIYIVKEGQAQSALESMGRERNRADQQASLAGKEASRARKLLSDYERLADVKLLERAIARSDELYPPAPELVPDLLEWQKEQGQLAERLVDHQKFLGRVRSFALSYGDEERAKDFAEELTELAGARDELVQIDARLVEGGEDEAVRALLAKERAALMDRIAELEQLSRTARRSWRFENETLQFQHDVLAELVRDLENFCEDPLGPVRSMPRRIELSRTIAQATVAGGCAELWAACRERIISNPAYGGLVLEPQLGLIPLGPDPDSNLEEFLHWLSHEGPPPTRDDVTGKIPVSEAIGVILVLVPAGRFLMGAQKDDPAKPNYDPDSTGDEWPVHQIELGAYLLSKCEMNQAQWQRAFGFNPSQYGPGTGGNDDRFRAAVDVRHPVEQVSWDDAQRYLPRVGLVLPTEAEWERAARAGRQDQIYSGCSLKSELGNYANLSGVETRAINFSSFDEACRDDWLLHAPVGSLEANGFGFHDMSGNVWEWCLDGTFASYRQEPGPRGFRDAPGERSRRGGSFYNLSNDQRVADRNSSSAVNQSRTLGLRPAKLIR